MLDGPAHMRAPVFMAHNRSAVGRASPRLTINEIGAGAKHCLLGGRISRQPMPRPISPFGDVDLASKSYEIQPAMARLKERGPAAQYAVAQRSLLVSKVYSGRENICRRYKYRATIRL